MIERGTTIAYIILGIGTTLLIVPFLFPLLHPQTEVHRESLKDIPIKCNSTEIIPIYLQADDKLIFYLNGVRNETVSLSDQKNNDISLNHRLPSSKSESIHDVAIKDTGFHRLMISSGMEKCTNVNHLDFLMVIEQKRFLEFINLIGIGSIMVSFSLGYIAPIIAEKLEKPFRYHKLRIKGERK